MAVVVVGSVPDVRALLQSRNVNPDKSFIFLSLETSSREVARTEPVPAFVPELATTPVRWFEMGMILNTLSSSPSVAVKLFLHDANKQPILLLLHQLSSSQLNPSESSLPVAVSLLQSIPMLLKCSHIPPSPLFHIFPHGRSPSLQACYFESQSGNLSMHEVLVEISFAPRISLSFLRFRLEQLTQRLQRLQQVHELALIQQGFVPGKSGYQTLVISVDSISHLNQGTRQTLTSPFVSIYTTTAHDKMAKKYVGRTNTEYRTANPAFNTNQNVSLCEHTKPSVFPQPRRFGRINAQLQLETTVRVEEDIVFEVYHERHSIRQEVSHEFLCQARIRVQQLPIGWNAIELPLFNTLNQKCGVLHLSFHRGNESSSANPFEDESLLWSSTYKLENVNALPPFWLLTQICQPIQAQIAQLTSMVAIDSLASFKPSTAKSTLSLAGMTTNLHQGEFRAKKNSIMYRTTTCGVPSAIALGTTTELHYAENGFDLEAALDPRSLAVLDPGVEVSLSTCPINATRCTCPVLNRDFTCGSVGVHEGNKPQRTLSQVTGAITSSVFRSAAASLVSKLTLVDGNNAIKPSWQTAMEQDVLLSFRETMCVAQALPSIASAFLAELSQRWNVVGFGNQLSQAGFLLGWESLVSSHGGELIMLQDVVHVVKWCNDKLSFRICISQEEEWSVRHVGHVLEFSLSPEKFFALFPGNLSGKQNVCLTLTLFSQGINEKQSYVNFMKLNDAHVVINQQSLSRLTKYCNLLFPDGKPALLSKLERLVSAQLSTEKQVEILWAAEDCIRALNGGMMIMCKSGKDRTAMAVTWEQGRRAQQEDSVSLMREFGVRIKVAEKNIGVPLYSFNSIQRMALPKEYRPPVSVIQDLKTSYVNQDTS